MGYYDRGTGVLWQGCGGYYDRGVRYCDRGIGTMTGVHVFNVYMSACL